MSGPTAEVSPRAVRPPLSGPTTAPAPADPSPDEPAAAPTRTRLWLDPVAWLVAAVATAVFALRGLGGLLGRDAGIFAYAGQQVADGTLPYLDVFNRDGPLGHVLPALGAWGAGVLGVDSLHAERVVSCAAMVGAVVATYALGRALWSRRGPGLVAAGVLLSFTALTTAATDGPREKTLVVLLVVLAPLLALRGRFLLAGVAVGLVTLTLQTGFFSAFAAVVVLALTVPTSGWTRVGALVRVGLGGTLTLAVTIGVYSSQGQLSLFLDNYWLLNREYTEGSPLLRPGPGVVRAMIGGYGWSLALLVLGLAAVVVLPLLDRLRRRRHRELPPALLAMSFAAAGGLVWSLADFDSWPDSLTVVPFASLGVVALGPILLPAGRTRLALGVVVVAACLVGGALTAVDGRNHGLPVQRDSVEAALSVLPDARIASLDGPQALVLSGRTNPTIYQVMGAAMLKSMDAQVAGGVDRFFADLREVDRPELVAVGLRDQHTMIRRLRTAYTVVGTAPAWVWWARSDLGLDTLTRLRDAVAPFTPRGFPVPALSAVPRGPGPAGSVVPGRVVRPTQPARRGTAPGPRTRTGTGTGTGQQRARPGLPRRLTSGPAGRELPAAREAPTARAGTVLRRR